MKSEIYFKHIGIKKPDIASIETLKEIHKHHLLAIPFENLDIIAGTPLSMDPSQIMKKIIDRKRGGICFETNTLLYAVLIELGFNVRYISAKFWNDEKQTWNPEFSHLALIVSFEEENYLADVGVGGGFLEPILLRNGFEYSDSNGSYRVIENSDSIFTLQKFDETWKDLLLISTETTELHLFEDQFLYYQTSKDTIFTQNKIVNLLTEDGRISLSDHQLKITKNHTISVTAIESPEDWQTTYNEIFKVRPNIGF
ncbi:arylamine N-acetyltransferase [Bacillus sp. EAC]|uniref:arylamine N-acetyltransferase family protein n=1 Tax=Bacillus sp. EAC TaxID=1978338 RepID=UPI0015C516C0|nr:arylamine N-acetyltransferase [Bacillus sp. EAC]